MTVKSKSGTSQYNPEHDPARQLAVELAFLRSNHDALQKEHAGKWIVVKGDSVIVADQSQFVAGTRARELGVAVPFIVRISSPADPPFYG